MKLKLLVSNGLFISQFTLIHLKQTLHRRLSTKCLEWPMVICIGEGGLINTDL